MNYPKEEWKADIRVGVVAVYAYDPQDPERFNCLDGERDNCIYYARGTYDHETGWSVPQELVANANLISAAPDMYEALKVLRVLLQDEGVKVLAQGLPNQIGLEAAFENIDKALAKAEGRE